MITGAQACRGHLTATEAIAVWKGALNEELSLATAGRYDSGNDDDRTRRVLEATYRIAANLEPESTIVSDDLLNSFCQGFPDIDRRAVVLMLKALGPHFSASTEAELVDCR